MSGTRIGVVLAIPIDELQPCPANPRSEIGDLTELADSIRQYGVLSPVMAERTYSGRFQLRYGHRRLAAARKAGLTAVPTIVVPEGLPDEQLITAMVENLHRSAMSPLDEARGCQALLDMGATRADVARRFARSAQWVAGRLALLDLPVEAQREVDVGALPLGPATNLARQVRQRSSGSVVIGASCLKHFVDGHPLAEVAHIRCDLAGHPNRGRVGPACGACWEHAIRSDQRTALDGAA